MQTDGKILSCTKDLTSDRYILTIAVPEAPTALPEDVHIQIRPIEKDRTRASHALFWVLIGKLAKALKEDKWYVYRKILRKYGAFESLWIDKENPDALAALTREWRDYEIVGICSEQGKEYFEVLCYYGSSKLDSEGFSQLIEGLKTELRNVGVEA